ncbi:PIH1 domain-containing 2, partial [Brachionus plicatilis]
VRKMDFINLSKTSKESKNDSYTKQAQHIWSMLDDMATSNPQSYKNFIDKTLKEGREALKPPEAHMCVKTSLLEPKKCTLFINVFSWNRIPEPKNDSDPIPVFGKELIFDKNVSFINIAFSPQILEKYGKNSNQKEELDMLIDLSIKFIQNQNKCRIDETNFSVLNSNFYGDLAQNLVNLTQKQSEKLKSDLDIAKEALDSMGLKNSNLPDNLLNELAGIGMDPSSSKESKRNLIEELDEKKIPEYEEKFIQNNSGCIHEIRIYLPKISSFKECDLNIDKNEVVLNALNYRTLKIALVKNGQNYDFDENKIEAKFVKNKSILKIKIPCQ